MSRGALAAALLFVCAWPMGCRCSDESGTGAPPTGASALFIDSAMWRMAGEGGTAITKEAFLALANKRLGRVLLRRLRVKRAVLNGELGQLEGKGVLVLEAKVHLESLRTPVETSLLATALLEGDQTLERLLEKGIDDLASALKELIRVAEGDRKTWLRSLRSPEMDVQILAARLLGDAKQREAVAPLAELLSDPRERVADVAADALVSIGDPKGVPAIIQSITRGDLRSEVRAIEIIGKLGGEEAEAYLEMTAVGHELEEVRQISGELLGELRKAETRLDPSGNGHR